MGVHVAFLRAINVGHRRVGMDRLRKPFEALGFGDVTTFIASGNVVFSTTEKPAAASPVLVEALPGLLAELAGPDHVA